MEAHYVKGKDMFLYSAVSSPLGRAKHFTLCPGQTCTFGYSFIQLSELGSRGENENAKTNAQTSKR